uniref:Na(+)/H(+) exchange regulatory cofactor NHE-RF n=1 Tax=Periophthalmus magnuspinnatus TaxID=409849 RepID=A0A3B4BER1_9GOBI
MGEMSSERRPRLCVMTKGDNGYGFHLHGEKGKSGQYIRKVEPGSPAEASGLRAGDRVVAVNGANVERETHHQVVQRIKAVENETRLLVVDQETYESLRSLHLTATEEMAIVGGGTQPIMFNTDKGRPDFCSLAQTPDLSPRLCHMARSDTGYGFNLHSDRSRPGQYIRSLDPGSPADQAGLRPQDRLIEVNGVNIEGMRHGEVVAFIKRGGDETWLLVVDPETDEHFKRRGITPTLNHVKDYDGPPVCNGQPSPQINGGSSTQSIRSTQSDLSSHGNSTQLLDPFSEMGLRLSATAAEEKMKIHAKEKRRAPQMDWMKKYELFRNF